MPTQHHKHENRHSPAEAMRRAAQEAFASIGVGHIASVLDTPTFADPAPDSASPPAALLRTETSVPFELWEALAYDMALGTTPDEVLAERLGVPAEELQLLRDNAYFAKLLGGKLEELQTLDDNAAVTVAYRMITNRAASHFLRRLTNPETSDKDFLNMFKTAVDMARLTPPPPATPAQAAAQASITFNIQGVPGLEHLMPHGAGGVTIEHEPAAASDVSLAVL